MRTWHSLIGSSTREFPSNASENDIGEGYCTWARQIVSNGVPLTNPPGCIVGVPPIEGSVKS